jgi:hypothetical protein
MGAEFYFTGSDQSLAIYYGRTFRINSGVGDDKFSVLPRGNSKSYKGIEDGVIH